jgi:cytochrome oxidase assembly protein ShyY1
MYRFLRSPRWVAGHALVLVAVLTFSSLGLWQLRRLDDRRTHNELLTERMSQSEVDLAALDGADPQDIAYLPVSVTGTFDPAAEVLLSTRSHGGRPGHHVLTPLRTPDGTTIVVDRGWVPLDWDSPPVRQAAPPDGEVQVRGLLHPSTPARRWGTLDGGDGAIQFVSDVDIPVLSEVTDTALFPLYVVAREQSPPQPTAAPQPADPPALDEGSHLSYAGQWFLFALVVTVGYPVLLRRTARDQRTEPPVADRDPEPTPVP